MRFGRKGRDAKSADGAVSGPTREVPEEASVRPFDIAEVDVEAGQYVDLGSLLIPMLEGRELRLQVDEATEQVQSVLLAAPDGALEVRAFAAPRGGDMWHDVRPQLVDDVIRRGGTAAIEDGRYGPEIAVSIEVSLPDGRKGRQDSRIFGFNGPRWFVRATLLGPASAADAFAGWDDALTGVVVNRGSEARPVGEPLPLSLPGNALRRTQP